MIDYVLPLREVGEGTSLAFNFLTYKVETVSVPTYKVSRILRICQSSIVISHRKKSLNIMFHLKLD